MYKKTFIAACAFLAMFASFHFIEIDGKGLNVSTTVAIALANPFDGGLDGGSNDGGCCDEGDGGNNDSPFDGGLPGGANDGGCCDEPTPTPTPTPDPEPEPEPEPDPAQCDFFTANPTSLPYGGGDVTLNWGTTNANSVSITGIGGVGAPALPLDGSRTVNVTTDTTFTLTANGTDGNDSCSVSIQVGEPQNNLTCTDLAFTSSATTVTPGSNVTLSWAWTGNSGITGATVNQGIGSVQSGDTRVVTVNNQTTYTTTITDGTQNVSCPLTVNVHSQPNGITCEANVNFSASDTSLPRGGGNITLTWSTTGLDSVSINGVASNNLSDSEVVSVTSDRTYTLTGIKNGQTINCPLSIDVDTGGGGGSNNPRCQLFEASDDEVSVGERVVLRWETSRAEEVTLYEGSMRFGKELFNTDDEDEVDEGEFVVRPTEDTTYTLHLERGSRNRTCDVEVEVDDNVVVLTDREQEPRVAGIALTQVPYTGFEAGPLLTILFYILLTLWGLFVAYTFAVKRDSILGFSLAGAFPRKQSVIDASVEVETESEEEVSRVADYVASATAAPANLPTGNAPAVGYAAVSTAAPEVVSAHADGETEADEFEESDEMMRDLENRAHAQHTLLSSDAMRYFADSYTAEEQFDAIDALIRDAKRTYPSEDGWVIINLERMQSLMDTTAVEVNLDSTPTGAGSLAEAIVTGNVAAAFEMIGNRPMLSLADATTDLDALYRSRTGADTNVSDLLKRETAKLTDSQLANALSALTSALDGTYSEEKEAVRTAILKAIKAVS